MKKSRRLKYWYIIREQIYQNWNIMGYNKHTHIDTYKHTQTHRQTHNDKHIHT